MGDGERDGHAWQERARSTRASPKPCTRNLARRGVGGRSRVQDLDGHGRASESSSGPSGGARTRCPDPGSLGKDFGPIPLANLTPTAGAGKILPGEARERGSGAPGAGALLGRDLLLHRPRAGRDRGSVFGHPGARPTGPALRGEPRALPRCCARGALRARVEHALLLGPGLLRHVVASQGFVGSRRRCPSP